MDVFSFIVSPALAAAIFVLQSEQELHCIIVVVVVVEVEVEEVEVEVDEVDVVEVEEVVVEEVVVEAAVSQTHVPLPSQSKFPFGLVHSLLEHHSGLLHIGGGNIIEQ